MELIIFWGINSEGELFQQEPNGSWTSLEGATKGSFNFFYEEVGDSDLWYYLPSGTFQYQKTDEPIIIGEEYALRQMSEPIAVMGELEVRHYYHQRQHIGGGGLFTKGEIELTNGTRIVLGEAIYSPIGRMKGFHANGDYHRGETRYTGRVIPSELPMWWLFEEDGETIAKRLTQQ